MARLLGIDATKTTVRVALIRTSYRKVVLEAVGEADIAWSGSEVDAIRAAIAGQRAEACSIGLSGERSFYRRIDLPAAAQKEIGNVLAFELEATVPFEMEEAVFDHRVLRGAGAETIPVFSVLARADDVRSRITAVREAIGVEPERVGSGPLPLANLVAVMPELEKPDLPGPLAILEVGDTTSEVVILVGGEAVFARTLSRGTVGLPASAPALARELRQTLAAWRTTGGDPLSGMYLVGSGASAPGAAHFLATELGVAILPLPAPRLEGITPEQVAELPRFAKALGLALGLTGRTKAMNLRRGALEAERSYPFLREKIPLLAGLGAVIAVSFGFSTIAELRTLDAEHEMLVARLGAATRDVFGEEITDVDKVKEQMEGGGTKVEEDPLPHVDAFDVMVQLSKAVPRDVVHDVIDLDVQRGKVILQGTVHSVSDSETIAKGLRENRCFKDVHVSRTAQFGEGKHKYVLEFELKCEDKKKKATPEPDGSAQPSASPSGKPSASPSGKPAAGSGSAKPDKEGGR
jgi:general secretion pathway protein L